MNSVIFEKFTCRHFLFLNKQPGLTKSPVPTSAQPKAI